MANDDDDDDDETGDDDWKQWPQAKAAAAELEITQKMLLQFVRQNKISQFRGGDGTWRYRPEELEKLREKMLVGTGDVPTFEANASVSDVLAANVALLKQAQDHLEAMMKMISAPMKVGIDFLTEQSRQINERLGKLEASRDELIATRERLLTEEEMRILLRKQEEGKERRRGEAFELVKEHGPKVLAQLGETFAARSPEGVAAVKLMNSLDPFLIEGLLEMDLLNDEQKSFLRAVVAKRRRTAAGAASTPKPSDEKTPKKPVEPAPDPSPAPAASPEAAAASPT